MSEDYEISLGIIDDIYKSVANNESFVVPLRTVVSSLGHVKAHVEMQEVWRNVGQRDDYKLNYSASSAEWSFSFVGTKEYRLP